MRMGVTAPRISVRMRFGADRDGYETDLAVSDAALGDYRL